MGRVAAIRFVAVPHIPNDRPRLVVSADGTLAAVAEPERIVIVELPSCEGLSEVTIDPHGEHEIAWLGTPPRLLVLARYEAHTTVHLLDPHGQAIAEIELASAVALFGAVGAHALVIGAQDTAILTAGESHLMPYQFPARAKPTVAGAAGNQFVVAIPGTIEEWDPAGRVPKRRLRLPRPTTITAVGGSERVVWMVTQQDPHRIDVLPLINRGQPKVHDLPEAIASVSGHPKSDLLVAVGGSGRAYAIDLDGRARLRALAFDGISHVETIGLVHGRAAGAVAAQRGRPLAYLPIETKEPTLGMPASMLVPTRYDEPAPESAPEAEEAPRVPTASSFVSGLVDAAMSIASKVPASVRPAVTNPPPVPPPASGPVRLDLRGAPEGAPPTKTSKNLAARMAAVREQREQALAGQVASPAPNPRSNEGGSSEAVRASEALTPISTNGSASAVPTFVPGAPIEPPAAPRPVRSDEPPASRTVRIDEPATALPVRSSSPALAIRPLEIQTHGSWRDELVDWTRTVLALRGDTSPMPPPHVDALDDLARRFDLSIAVGPALTLLYGAHLLGHDGVAPADLSRVLDRSWAEALGRGELAATGVARYERSRVRFAPAVQRVLDELPPTSGTLVGVPGRVEVDGPRVLVEQGDALDIAAAYAPRAGGAILVGSSDDPREVLLEARAIGATAMLPASRAGSEASGAVIYVCDDEAEAERIGLPRFS